MPLKMGRGDKRRSLLAYKEKLLQELKYYEQRIDETRRSANKSTSFDDGASSDSDTGLPQLLDSGPPILQLKQQQAMLKTCLQATQELASLKLVQYEVNMLPEPPSIEGEPKITEEGTWHEVTAECCVDLIPFSVTFYTFRADRKFAPLQYRGLKVLPLKPAHEVELSRSVLPGLKRPSDAVEVLRSYAVSYRARRSSLARLAEKFAAALHMEPLAEGGYLLKCTDILELSWTLQNKWSPIVPFQHKMKIDIEYMDEQYIKTITQANRELSNPTIDTDERTLLLATIISTCLQARPSAPGGSGTEALDCDTDREVMAPPRSLPKKVKTKNKENIPTNQKAAKRSAQHENSVATLKKPRATEQGPQDDEVIEKIDKESKKTASGNVKTIKSVGSERISPRNVAAAKNKPDKNLANVENAVSDRLSQENIANTKNRPGKSDANDKTEISDKISQKNIANAKNKPKKSVANDKNKLSDKNSQKDVGHMKRKADDGVASVENAIPSKKSSVATSKNDETHSVDKVSVNSKKTDKGKINKKVDTKRDGSENVEKNKAVTKTIANVKSVPKKPLTEKENTKSVGSANSNIKNPKNIENTEASSNTVEKPVATKKKKADNPDLADKIVSAKDPNEKVGKTVKKVVNEDGKAKAVKKAVSAPKPVTESNVDTRNSVGRVEKEANKDLDKQAPSNIKDKPTKSVASVKNITQTLSNINKKTDTAKNQSKKALTEKNIPKPTISSKPSKVPPKPKIPTAATKVNMSDNTEKENVLVNKAKMSKIPQKKITTPKLIKKMPNRASPRKPLPKPKSPLAGAGANMKRIVHKPVTGIPRLMTKPKSKIT